MSTLQKKVTETEMSGGVGKLTPDSINMSYMYHWWTYVTLIDVFLRRNATGQFRINLLMLYLCPPATDQTEQTKSKSSHKTSI